MATMDVYKAAVSTFLPTPSKSHYVFNLRDFARVVFGVLLVPKTHMSEGDKLIRLWVHEVYRVFSDRLTDENDKLKFFEIVKDTTQQQFKISLDKLLRHLAPRGQLEDDNIRGLFFGDYMTSGDMRAYDEVTDFAKLTDTMERCARVLVRQYYVNVCVCLPCIQCILHVYTYVSTYLHTQHLFQFSENVGM